MMLLRFAWLPLYLATSSSLLFPSSKGQQEKPTNYVILFADDYGYGDSSLYGHPTITTPGLERMAREGLRFTRWYSANPICSPSRAALITGRLSVRTGMSKCSPTGGDSVFEPLSIGGLPTNETTIAELLKTKGFATQMVGKWHMGINEYNSTDCTHCPTNHGFDHFFGTPFSNTEHCADEDSPLRCFLYRDNKIMEQPSDYTNISFRLLEEAKQFISMNQNKSFFLYYAFLHTHVELFASKTFAGTSRRGAFGDVSEMDFCINSLLDHLVDLKLETSTLVFFTSDNGPWLQQGVKGGSAGLLRGGKLQTWNGGIMEPGLAWWPGTIVPRITLELVSTMDMSATIADFEETPLPNLIDGKSIRKLLLQPNATSPHDFLFHYCGCHLMAVTHGPYKAHFVTQAPLSGSCAGSGTTVENPPLLFNSLQDPSEKYPIGKQDAVYAEVMEEINEAVKRHKATLKPVPLQQNRGTENKLQPCCNPPKCCCGPACTHDHDL